MRRAIFTLAVACLAFAGDPLEFQGIGMNTGLLSLATRFPLSDHSFWGPDGVGISFKDERAAYRERITHGSGRYIGRLTTKESVAHLYYLDGTLENGVWSQLLLSFERPSEIPAPPRSAREHAFSRCPPCAPVLTELTRKYGKPAGPAYGSEESLERHTYSWTRPEGEMQLVCGNYQLERTVFAMHVLLKPARR